MTRLLKKAIIAAMFGATLFNAGAAFASDDVSTVKFYVRNCDSDGLDDIRVCVYDRADSARWAPATEKVVPYKERKQFSCESSNDKCQVYATTGDGCALSKGGTMDTSNNITITKVTSSKITAIGRDYGSDCR